MSVLEGKELELALATAWHHYKSIARVVSHEAQLAAVNFIATYGEPAARVMLRQLQQRRKERKK